MITQEMVQVAMQERMMDVARYENEKAVLAHQKQDALDRRAPVDGKRRVRIPAFLANVLLPATTYSGEREHYSAARRGDAGC